MARRILVVDDDPDIVKLLQEALGYEQMEVAAAFDGLEALERIEREDFDLIVLDIMMPGLDGLETTRKIRQKHHMPILLLSARDREIDKVIGLEIGADDYLTKPFGIQELVARIKAQFRQMERLASLAPISQANPSSRLEINEQTYDVKVWGEKIELSTLEFLIFKYLADHPMQVLSREQIYQNVWKEEAGDLNTVTVHIKNIRKRLGQHHPMIRTVWGIGYQFCLGVDSNETS